MKPTKQWLEGAKLLCDAIGPDDGLDSRLLSRSFTHEKTSYKSWQLCKVAKHSLTLVLSGEFSDPMLHNLVIVDVTPHGEGESLLISFSNNAAGSVANDEKILEKLHAIQGSLRAAIARSVKRKRVPALRFKQVQGDSEESSHACL
jgi:ribosome-binding factor A